MFTILTFDNLYGSRSPLHGSPMPLSRFGGMVEVLTKYALAHGDVWELHARDVAVGGRSVHLTFWADKPLDLVALADIAERFEQDAIGVLQGSTLVGPGSADFPTTVKPSNVA